MRIALAVLLVATAAAHADPPAQAVEKLVTTHVTQLDHLDVDKLGFAKEHTIVIELSEWSPADMPFGAAFGLAGTVTSKLGTPAIAFGDGFAWFQLPYDIHVESPPESQSPHMPYDGKRRVGGIAIQTAAGWQLAAVHYARLVPDAQLFDARNLRNNAGAMPAKPKLDGDAALAKDVAGWFPSGLAAHAATKGVLLASGTAPAESRTGAATSALVKGWDALGMMPERLTARVVAPGKVGFAVVEVHAPRKGGGDSIRMTCTIVVVRDGASWRWVSLEFSA